MAAKIRVRHALPWWQRLRRRWRAWRGAELGKTHVVHFVELDQRRYKRVSFAEPETARLVAAAVEALAGTGRVPALLRHQDCELWLEYVPGRPPKPQGAADQARLVSFFSELYALDALQFAADPLPFAVNLRADVDFLVSAGVLHSARAQALQALEHSLRPPSVWRGPDYIDPLAKNFVVLDERLVAIDIEALQMDAVLGMGLAKARLRWPFDPFELLCQAGADGPASILKPQLPWVELCFLCAYFRQKLQQGKPGYVRLSALDQLFEVQTAKTPP